MTVQIRRFRLRYRFSSRTLLGELGTLSRLTLLSVFISSPSVYCQKEPESLVQLVRNEGFNILVALIRKGNLADLLDKGGPFTVLAPTDNALMSVNRDVLKAVANDPSRLKRFLLTHIISGVVLSQDIRDSLVLSSISRENLNFQVTGDGIYINGSRVDVPDVLATNGVIHVLSKVLWPIKEKLSQGVENMEIVLRAAGLTDFMELLSMAGLEYLVTSEVPYTLFVPPNSVIRSLDPTLLQELKQNKKRLQELMKHHVVNGSITSNDLLPGKVVTSLLGKKLFISNRFGELAINGVIIALPDIKASNGYIHVIREVLVPPKEGEIIFPVGEITPKPGNLVEMALKAGFTAMVSLLETINMQTALASESGFTLLVPTDNAFNDLPDDLVFQMKMIPSLLEKVIHHHIIEENILSKDMKSGIRMQSMDGQLLSFIASGSDIFVNGAKLLNKDIEATNGVMHVIDKVILPFDMQKPPNMAQMMRKEGLDKFSELLDKAGLADQASYGGPFTAFVPSDEAFNSLSSSFLGRLTSTSPQELRSILLYHFVPGIMQSSDVAQSSQAETLQGGTLRFTNMFGGTRVNVAKLLHTDMEAENGIIHVIDRMLIPPTGVARVNVPFNNLMGLISSNGLSILKELLEKTGLHLFINEKGPFTVFAPSNKAFAALDPGLLRNLSSNLGLMRQVLLYHIVPGKLLVRNLRNQLLLKTSQSENVRINVYSRMNSDTILSVNGGRVIQPDWEVDNGALHVIDKVLFPPAGNILQVLESDQRFSVLSQMFLKSGLSPSLSKDGPHTLFAPTNAAFSELPLSTLKYLMENADALRDFLLMHMVAPEEGKAPLFAAALCWDSLVASNGAPIRTGLAANGQVVLSTLSAKAAVIQPDLAATNGVIHVIDAVL